MNKPSCIYLGAGWQVSKEQREKKTNYTINNKAYLTSLTFDTEKEQFPDPACRWLQQEISKEKSMLGLGKSFKQPKNDSRALDREVVDV